MYNGCISFKAMGTLCSAEITTVTGSGREALAELRDKVTSLDAALSVFRPDSEISRLNAAAGSGWMELGTDALTILRRAKLISALSDGAFSVTTGPLTAMWRECAASGRVPDKAEIDRTRKMVCDGDLELDGTRARLRCAGQSVDLGSIAKGYAADCAVGILRKHGVSDALLNFGGTVVSLGHARPTGIQHPRRPTGMAMGEVSLEDAAAVTSGDYERSFAGHPHIMDPRTGDSARSGLISVTAVGKLDEVDVMTLDALTTAVFVLGASAAAPLMRRFECRYILVGDDLAVWTDHKNFKLNATV